jgi:hypothetical protein
MRRKAKKIVPKSIEQTNTESENHDNNTNKDVDRNVETPHGESSDSKVVTATDNRENRCVDKGGIAGSADRNSNTHREEDEGGIQSDHKARDADTERKGGSADNKDRGRRRTSDDDDDDRVINKGKYSTSGGGRGYRDSRDFVEHSSSTSGTNKDRETTTNRRSHSRGRSPTSKRQRC